MEIAAAADLREDGKIKRSVESIVASLSVIATAESSRSAELRKRRLEV